MGVASLGIAARLGDSVGFEVPRSGVEIRQWLSRWFRLEKTSSPAEQIYFGFSDEEARAVVWLLSGSSFLNNVSALSCGCYSPRISMSGWVGCSLGGRLRAVLG
ncbi:hypothetical protein Bca52824_054067 [Brassica carinata]|uniref:Uncharacterized protein n=1 Tax=Brassica carinata TaxID=52824 RepID=A0A8X7R780_BRACI|nr:hypothetical protein Bca52824_054067 [Brassica carinata]